MSAIPAAWARPRGATAWLRGPGPLGLAIALAAPGLVALLRLLPDPPRLDVAGWLFLLAVAAAASLGGTAPSLVAIALSTAFLDYFFIEPRDRFGRADAEDVLSLSLFVVAALLVSQLLDRRRRSQASADAARRRAELETERLTRLQTVAAALAEALTPQDVLRAVVEHGVHAADAVAGLIGIVDPEGERVEIVADQGYGPELQAWRSFPLADDYPFSVVIRTGEPLFFATTAERDARFPVFRDLYSRRSHAFAALPLVVEGRMIGALGLTYGEEVQFDEERKVQKVALARLAAQALERSRYFEAEKHLRERLQFLSQASQLLASSMDYETTLHRLADLTVPRLADWCTIDIVDEDGTIERLAIAHEDPEKRRWATELQERYPPNPGAQRGVPAVIRSGKPEFIPEITDELLVEAVDGDEKLLEILRALVLRSAITVPLVTRGRVLGALSMITGESGRRYTELDLRLAEDLARRAAVAVDNARLYHEAERRGDAARALAYTDDGVLLLDGEGNVRFLNTAARTILGVGEQGSEASSWRSVQERLGALAERRPTGPLTVPIVVEGAERWIAVSQVDFGEGVVYAFRDVTDERALERARSEFVATASHELRTPVAAIYGAVRTIRRTDIELDETTRERLMQIIEEESDRLGDIVDQVLLAGRLDEGELSLARDPCDVGDLARSVAQSAALSAPETVAIKVDADGAVLAACDADRLRQVVTNLVDNAIKYSPGGGAVEVVVGRDNGVVKVEVRDEGLGIPPGFEERIFEKFFRLDPGQTQGIGGTGLGLYIARELVERMDGQIRVEQNGRRGSRFVVELPAAAA